METVTSTTLLEAIKNGEDHLAWGRFTARYRPMIVTFAARLGLGPSDAEDIGQETLLAFFRSLRNGQFDHQKGRLRSWLFTIARNNATSAYRRTRKEVASLDRTDADRIFQLEFPNRLEAIWNEEWQRSVVQACLEEVSRDSNPQTMEIFTLNVLKAWPAKKVARHLDVPVGTVYLVKNRLLKKFRAVLAKMEAIW